MGKKVNDISYQVIVSKDTTSENVFSTIKEAREFAKGLASTLEPGTSVDIVKHFYKSTVLNSFTVKPATSVVTNVLFEQKEESAA